MPRPRYTTGHNGPQHMGGGLMHICAHSNTKPRLASDIFRYHGNSSQLYHIIDAVYFLHCESVRVGLQFHYYDKFSTITQVSESTLEMCTLINKYR